MPSYKANPQPARRRPATISSVGLAIVGALIFVVNLGGLFVPLRSPDIDGYRDFAGVETLRFDETIARLEALRDSDKPLVEMITDATRIFHEGIAHVTPADVDAHGLEHYRMRVPATENWILFLLSYLKPDTYADYEFCSYRRALERGIGRCGQQSLALVSFLADEDIETGFVALGGHAVATAKVDDTDWYILDPDYGAVIPFDITKAEQDPDSVLEYYWSYAAHENDIHRVYAPENEVKYGGPEARYRRACPIEQAAYIMKWAVPAALAMPLLLLFAAGKLRRR